MPETTIEHGSPPIRIAADMKHLLLIALAAATLVTADATGTWTGKLVPSDGQARPAYLVLKQDGDELTGDETRERDGQTRTAKLAVKRVK